MLKRVPTQTPPPGSPHLSLSPPLATAGDMKSTPEQGSAETTAGPGGVAAGMPQDADGLLAGYAATDYFVAGLASPLHPGDPHADLADFLVARGAASLAVFTAHDPRSETMAHFEQRLGALRAALESLGLRCIEAEGRPRDGSAGPSEPLLAVLDVPPRQLQRLMKDFGEHAVLLAERHAPPRLWLLPEFMLKVALEEHSGG